MTEIINKIDLNSDWNINDKEYQDFRNVMKNDEQRIKLYEELNNNDYISELILPSVNKLLTEFLSKNQRDDDSAYLVQFYVVEYLWRPESEVG